jgi:hypothetical protein
MRRGSQFDVVTGDKPTHHTRQAGADISLLAARELGIEPTRCVAVEDAPRRECRRSRRRTLRSTENPDADVVLETLAGGRPEDLGVVPAP